MVVKVRCTNRDCGQSYKVAEELLGDTAVCNKCQRSFVLQSAARETAAGRSRSDTVAPRAPFVLAKVPDKLGRFEVRKRLGAGAFGAVYHARDPLLDRDVALKIPHASTLQSESRKARFLTEAKAAGQLRHPNIVPVYEAGNDHDTYYIASAFIEGQTLEDAIDERKFDFRQAAKLIMDLAGALDYAHHRGIVHRDIKPANIMLDAQGDPLLMDFGLARLDAAASKLTHDGTVLGTPAYMPPEQAAGKLDQVGPASDQYSLGVVLYELLCGEAPFSGPPALVISLVINQEPNSPRGANPAVPKDLETICLKAMAKNPAHRYAHCREMGDDLRRWLASEPVMARRIGPLERFGRWCRRNPVVAGLSATAAALLLMVAVVSVWAYAKTSRALAKADEERERAEHALTGEAAQRERAEQSLTKEAHHRKRAEESENAAVEEKRHADEERRRAEEQRDLAEESERTALAEKRRAEQNVYYARILLAQRDWLAGESKEANHQLDASPEEFRGWEWRFLKRRCNPELLTLRGHTDWVNSVAFSPDARRIASAGADGTVRLWDAASGNELLVLHGDENSVDTVAFSPDGKRLACGTQDQTVRIWDIVTGRESLTVDCSEEGVTSIAFSPNGKRIATGGSSQNTAEVWDATTGRRILALRGGMTGREGLPPLVLVPGVAFSPDGDRIATGSTDNCVRIWNAATGRNLLTLRGHEDHVTSVTFSPDGLRVASASYDYTIRIWDAATGQPMLKIQLATALRGVDPGLNFDKGDISIAFNADGKRIAIGAWNETLTVWDAHTGQRILNLQGHADAVHGVAFSPDGARLVSGSYDATLRIWDATAAAKELIHSASGEMVSDVRFSMDGNWIASASWDGTVKLWDASTGDDHLTLRAHTGAVTSVSFSPDAKWIASASVDNTIRVWECATGEQTAVLEGHNKQVNSVAFSADGRRIASGSADKTVRIWDAQSVQEAPVVCTHEGVVTSVAFSPDGLRIASAASDKTLKVWDVTTGLECETLRGHAEDVNCVAFSQDGKRIVSGSDDKTVRIWDAATGRQMLTLRGHTEGVNSVAFSADGERIASASGHEGLDQAGDKTVRIWDATTGQETLRLEEHAEGVESVAFSRDGRKLATASTGGTVTIWDATALDALGDPAPAATGGK